MASWTTFEGAFTAEIGQPPQKPADGSVPVDGNAAGDRLVTAATGGIRIEPAGGAPAEPAPSSSGTVVLAAPRGRAAALVWGASPTQLALSVWRP
jgi:hypothetical protein